MTSTYPAGNRARGSFMAAAALALALGGGMAACGTSRGGDDAGPVRVLGATAGADTGIAVEARPGGELQASVGIGRGRRVLIVGPDPDRGSLGFTYRFASLQGKSPQAVPEEYASITAVAPGSPAESAGLRTGDVMLAVNGRDGRNAWLLHERAPGTAYDLRVRRGDGEHDVRVVVGPAPSRAQVEWDLRRQAGCIRQAAGVADMSGGDEITACILPY